MNPLLRKTTRLGAVLTLSAGTIAGGAAFGASAAHASTSNSATCHTYGSATAIQAAIVNSACTQMRNGVVYSWGGGHGAHPGASTGQIYVGPPRYDDRNKVGVDCSGLVRLAAYQGTGRDIGAGGTSSMPQELRSSGWTQISSASQPGDVVVYNGHTVIYMGGGQVVQAEGDAEGLTTAALSGRTDVQGVFRYGGTASPTPPPTSGSKVFKNVWATAPSVNSPSNGARVGILNKGSNYFYCQTQGSEASYDGYHNNWWLKTDDDSGHANVWVNATYISGGVNDGAISGVPHC